MMSPHDEHPKKHRLDLCCERDARICSLLATHPITAAMLVRLGWFPTKSKALRRLGILVRRGRIRLTGTVCRKPGRPEHVYCRIRPKRDSLLHEVLLTEVCLRIDAAEIRRGPRAVDPALRPDAEAFIGGRRFLIELDRGTMGYAQIERRFRTYMGCGDLVLWVCKSAERTEAMRRRAEGMRHVFLFTTLGAALMNPHSKIWIDWAGGRAALPRESARPAARAFPEDPE